MSIVKKNSTFLTILVMLALMPVVHAETKEISISVTNPDGAVSDLQVVFFIPFGATPVNLQDEASWDEDGRRLEIGLGEVGENESREVRFTLDGAEGSYLINGQLLGIWPETDDAPQETFEETIAPFTVYIGMEPPESILTQFVRNLRAIPQVEDFVNNIAKPAVAALGVLGIGAVVNSAVSSLASVAVVLSKVLSYLGLGFLRLRRKNPWGRVYNQLTGKPIEGATVRVIATGFNKIKETQSTDKEGRFGFLVARGSYYVRVSNRGFEDKATEVINVSGPGQTLSLEIPVRPLESALSKNTLAKWRIIHGLRTLLNKLSPWLLVAGFLLSAFSSIVVPALLNYILLGLYAVMIILKIVLRQVTFKSFGWVVEKGTEKPLDLAVIRVFDADRNWLLGTRVSDHEGRFNFLIGPGNYYATAVREGYKPFQSQAVHFSKSGIIAYDINLEK